MIKQIKMVIKNDTVVALMNEEELFSLTLQNKEIKLEDLYKKLNVDFKDKFDNKIEELTEQNKTSVHFLYENTKLFLSTLIEKLNNCINNFNETQEKEILVNLS